MSEKTDYEITIGIECHVQLATKTKLFSEVDNDARGKEPNSCVSPVDISIHQKLADRGYPMSVESIESNLNDIAGI